MNQKTRILLFLAKNYAPFTHFSPDMFQRAGDALRIIDIKGGESFTLQASGGEDYLFIIKGSANIKQQDQPSLQVMASDIRTQPILFDEAIKITTDSHATICHADSAMIHDYLSLKAISDLSQTDDSEALTERLMFLKSTRVFRLLPVNVIEEAAKRCEELTVASGNIIVRQDVRAGDFYVLLEGDAEVWREELEEDEPQIVALLGSGDSFGKEALIIGGGHKATIKMITDGILLKLSKADFDELISPSALRSVSVDVAQVMLKAGAKIIDVRYQEEYEKVHIPGSVLFPLPELRSHIPSFDKSKEYLVLCAIGLRAAAATLLLRQQDINAVFIEGGIKAWPIDAAKNTHLELILFNFCPFAQRAVITLKHCGIPHKLTYLDPDNLPGWFTEVSPFGRVPILRVDKKMTIFESSVINELIATLSTQEMHPSNPIEHSLSRSWIEFGSTLLEQLTAMICAKDKASFIQVHQHFRKNLQRLEEQIEQHGAFSSKDSFSLIDSTYAPLFMRMKYLYQQVDIYQQLFTKANYPHIQAWSERLLTLEPVINSVPSNFNSIYTHFIHWKGASGYLASTMKKNSPKINHLKEGHSMLREYLSFIWTLNKTKS